MSLQEMKEVIATLLFSGAVTGIAFLYILYIFAKISYKKAHKNVKKVDNTKKKTQIIYNLGDTKNMTLQEIQVMKRQMRREIMANV